MTRPSARLRPTLLAVACSLALGPADAAAQSATSGAATFLQPNVEKFYTSVSDFAGSEDPVGACGPGGPFSDRSFWWKVRGTGGRLIFTTRFFPTVPDTMVYVYSPDSQPPAGLALCDNDIALGNPRSEVVIQNSVAGGTYHVAVGVCVLPDAVTFCGVADGRTDFGVISNDQRQFADAFVNETRTNVATTTDPGEVTSCAGTQYGATVWYRYLAPAKGRVALAVASSSTNTVMSVYRGAATTPAACNVNSATDSLRSEVAADVTAGEELLVQIGSEGNGAGGLALSAGFVEDVDLDDDGFPRGADCNEANAAINPGAADVPNNGVDEDCRDGDNTDGDRDGVGRPADCNDADAGISPRVPEIAGNRVDENCDGRALAGRLDPLPQITFGSFREPRGRQFGELTVADVRRGYRVVVRCSGSRSCPRRRSYTRTLRGARVYRLRAFAGRLLVRPARVEVTITWPGTNTYGVFRRFAVVAGRRLLVTNCTVQPGSAKRTRCRRG